MGQLRLAPAILLEQICDDCANGSDPGRGVGWKGPSFPDGVPFACAAPKRFMVLLWQAAVVKQALCLHFLCLGLGCQMHHKQKTRFKLILQHD